MRTNQRTAVLAAALATLATVSGTHAAATWDGGDPASPNASGNWNDLTNWDSAAVPTTTDVVTLPSVTDSSTRTVTQDIAAGTTANALAMLQSGLTSGVNKLSLSGNLTLSLAGSRASATVDSPLSALRTTLSDGAATNQAQIDLNGKSIAIPGSGTNGVGANLAGVINYNSAGSSIHATTTNTYLAFNVFGTLNVSANGVLGRVVNGSITSGTTHLVNMMSGSELNISSGTFAVAQDTLRGTRDVTMLFSNSGTIDIASGATLQERWTSSSNTNVVSNIAMTNNTAGVITQAGTLEMRPHRGPTATTDPTVNVTNNGLWKISGANAVVKRLTTSGSSVNAHVPNLTVGGTGTLRGNSASDTLEFDEQVADGTRRMTITSNGIVAPGAGTNLTGLTSVGSLSFRDINATFGTTAILQIDVGGALAGEYDTLNLATGLTDAAGAGTLDLSAAGDTLEVTLVNGFDPETSPGVLNIPILTYGNVVLNAGVGFDSLKINGSAAGPSWSVVYGATSANLVLVPEPTTLGLLGLAGMGLIRRRR